MVRKGSPSAFIVLVMILLAGIVAYSTLRPASVVAPTSTTPQIPDEITAKVIGANIYTDLANLKTSFYASGTIPDVIVYKDGDYAVAYDTHTKKIIIRSMDHTDVIQKAVDNGYIIMISEGTYIIDKTILLPNGVTLVGAGRQKTILKLADNANTDMFRGASYDNGYVNLRVVLMNLELDGNKENNSAGNGILWNVYQGRIINCYIHDFPEDGIKIYGFSSSANAIENIIAWNEIRNNGGAGIDIANTYATDNHILFNYIAYNDGSGIVINTAWDQHIYGNHIYANFPIGILIRNSERVRIIGNHIATASSEAIKIVASTTTYVRRIIIADNHLIASATINYPAISLIGYDTTYIAMYIIIQGNQFLRINAGSFTYAVKGTNDNFNIIVENIVDPDSVSLGAFNLTGLNNTITNNIT